MTRNRRDNLTMSSDGADSPTDYPEYIPPFQQVLAVLRLSDLDTGGKTVNVSTAGLLFLLREALRRVPVDEDWYIARYPDVHAAILAGDTPSAAAHFRTAGYFEGRLPRQLSLDPDHYVSHYTDLAEAFAPADRRGLEVHFETSGYREGRAGIPGHLGIVERWQSALESR